ncbi:hypothetical protein Tco_1100142 [Tanacetum coccineum]
MPVTVSPTANSPGYVPESDPEEDPKEDDDEDPEEDPADYPTDRDNDDDEEEELSGDEADDKEEEEDDEEEEEKHSAPTDSVPPPVHHIPSPPLPVSPPPPASPTYPLVYHTAIIQLRANAPSTSHSLLLPPPIILSCTRSDAPPSGTQPILPIPLPTSSPSLLLPSTDHGADKPEVCLPPWKRLCFAFGPRYESRESSSAPITRPTGGFRADYGFIATLDREIRAPATDETELGRRMTNIVNIVRQDTYEIYVRLSEAQDEREAKLSRKAWGRSMDASELARSKVMALRT